MHRAGCARAGFALPNLPILLAGQAWKNVTRHYRPLWRTGPGLPGCPDSLLGLDCCIVSYVHYF